MDTLGKRIKYVREKMSLNQQQMAEKLGLKTGMALSQYESDQRVPGLDKIVEISDMANVSIEWLVKGRTGGTERSTDDTKGDAEVSWPVKVAATVSEGLRPYEVVYWVDRGYKDRIKDMLVESKKDEQWLGKMSGIDVRRIRGFITGRVIPSLGEFDKMGSVLGVNPRWLAEHSPFIMETKLDFPEISISEMVKDDPDLLAIIDFLKNKMPDMKKELLKFLEGAWQQKEAYKGMQRIADKHAGADTFS